MSGYVSPVLPCIRPGWSALRSGLERAPERVGSSGARSGARQCAFSGARRRAMGKKDKEIKKVSLIFRPTGVVHVEGDKWQHEDASWECKRCPYSCGGHLYNSKIGQGCRYSCRSAQCELENRQAVAARGAYGFIMAFAPRYTGVHDARGCRNGKACERIGAPVPAACRRGEPGTGSSCRG